MVSLISFLTIYMYTYVYISIYMYIFSYSYVCTYICVYAYIAQLGPLVEHIFSGTMWWLQREPGGGATIGAEAEQT